MGYSIVESNDPLLDEGTPSSFKGYMKKTRSGRGTIWTATTFALAAAAFVLSCVSTFKPDMLHSHSHALSEPPREWLDCGTTPETAREKGCIFDPVFFAWQPAPCHFPDAMQWALEAGNFTWFFDKELTQPVPDAQVRAGGPHSWLYTRNDFHYFHCGYLWMRQARMLKARGWMTDVAMDIGHTEHCKDLMNSLIDGIPEDHSTGKVLYWKCLKM